MPIDRNQPIADEVPWSDSLTAYDDGHLAVYLRLIKMSKAGVPDDELCRQVLGIDPAREPERARTVLARHMKRARWMTETGYRELARRPD